MAAKSTCGTKPATATNLRSNPPVKLPDLGPDPYDEHGAPRAQASCAPSTPSLGQGSEAQGAIRICAQCRAGSPSDPPAIEVTGRDGERL
jgi:hypothetical protein